jgi:hypothetical protein
MAYFSDRDRALVEVLTFDPNSTPSFEYLKACLVWRDESPNGITPDGYEKLCDLWISRSCLHQGKPVGADTLDPDYFVRAWQAALDDKIQWPGFRRLTLSAEDQAYYDGCLREIADPNYEL